MIDREKYVDESWKESVEVDKAKFSSSASAVKAEPSVERTNPQPKSASTKEEPLNEMDVNFLNYVASLGYQAMIFLGEMPHPATNQMEKNPDQAKLLIDTLVMLREKTKGNLKKQEEDMLNTSIYELQMKFVELNGEQGASTDDR